MQIVIIDGGGRMEYLWIALAAIAVIIVLWYIATYNKFVGLKVRIEEAFSTIDVYLKKRYDLVPNLVETVKGYASHEVETFEAVVNARSRAHDSSNVEDKIRNEGELTKALGRLMVLAESYPELKADSQFLNLQTQLRDLEDEISQSRKYYNGVVKSFNTMIISFPSMIVANLAKFTKAEFFLIDREEQRENVKVSFNQ
ncbi:MAG: LemA family protein [Saccharofermentanales bacterium]|jgi:LemA protein